MKIGIFSDIHDRTNHLEQAMHRMLRLGCGHFIFLGDCTTPESFRRLLELAQGLPLDAVPGNNDYEMAGNCLIANPGELQGRTGRLGFGILDTDSRTMNLHTLDFKTP